MNILLWIAFGIAAGVVAHLSDSQLAKGGILGAIGLGVLGAVTGGFLANYLFKVNIASFDLASFVIAITTSLLLLLIHRTLLSEA